MTTFKAFVTEKVGEKEYSSSIQNKNISDLPEGDVLVKVAYSSLNYKDALSALGKPGVTKNYPHTPGIDAAGVVVSSNTSDFKEGDEVIVTSYDLGMNTWGGFSEYIQVPSGWVIPKPAGISLKDSMKMGTAGLTAAMSVYKLVDKVAPEDGNILVTGATGGVGSIAIAILNKLGYSVVTVTGKADKVAYLKSIGAVEVLSRDEFLEGNQRPLLKPRFAGVIDTVGGEFLATAIKSTNPLGVVTCCGNASSFDLPLNVFPFILRGVSLIGIDSQNFPRAERIVVWENIAKDWLPSTLDEITEEVSLDGLKAKIDTIIKGQLSGRVLVKL
ncbi:YhdH/YhfP family quinone oxidoreductase [Flammeovirga kamogawensis]|uniref:YhdH/YhfP family quinone oxidoreductase n=1 Tax=Flammeovirga kamogawensis TaxID=373891 RepID=A0ABX8GVC4_9BACT|nr:YhdH/YhfP family quinone oxidoreductase [Flammeovirga kamogawensis]MBB6461605.1 putative YhdH/YhfP family quinone oxidoreductase [Flammeovirga kamogawensis]QWG07466.1 YhdH/YhfP family quinone oxidoreductase [Flammeovirga kamogawensis]TRX69278.1 acryloyl-CoA reductase [Flammeovirga kamogawensis]